MSWTKIGELKLEEKPLENHFWGQAWTLNCPRKSARFHLFKTILWDRISLLMLPNVHKCAQINHKHFDIVHLYCNAMKALCNEIKGSSGPTSCQIPDKLRPHSTAKQNIPSREL